jgi:hypothetical protein
MGWSSFHDGIEKPPRIQMNQNNDFEEKDENGSIMPENAAGIKKHGRTES